MPKGTFYEEDGMEIMDAITFMMEHENVPRIDLVLNSNDNGSRKSAKVYWENTVLRVDIEGLK